MDDVILMDSIPMGVAETIMLFVSEVDSCCCWCNRLLCMAFVATLTAPVTAADESASL